MKKFISLVLCFAMFLALPVQTQARTVTATVDAAVDEMPCLKVGTTTVKLEKPTGEQSKIRSVLFRAPETGTYKVKLSNVKIANTPKGSLAIFTYTGKESGMFFKYGYKDVKVNSSKVHTMYVVTKGWYTSLPKSGEDNVYREVTRDNMNDAKQFYNPTFNIKLKKDECLMLEGYYLRSYEDSEGVNGKEVYKDSSYKITIKEVK